MNFLTIGFIEIGLFDIIDILVVALIFYYLLLLMKGTRAAEMLVGAVLFVAFWFVAVWLRLDALSWMISRVLTVGVIAFVILFQPELRAALARLGQNPLLQTFLRVEESQTLDEVVKAVMKLSQAGLGGLLVLEREAGLKNLLETGQEIRSKVTAELIVTIFTPPAPLHDGAIIIKGDTILAAGCALPLTDNPKYGRLFGMRHRAAVGVTENSDAVAVVVSEETGIISAALEGRLRRNLDASTLKSLLLSLLQTEARRRVR